MAISPWGGLGFLQQECSQEYSKLMVMIGGSVILQNKNKVLGKVVGALTECFEHRENYSAETLAYY